MHESDAFSHRSTAPLTIRVAESPADWHAVHRLRYDCFVAESGQAEDTADHEHRLLRDEMDSISTTLIAVEGDQIVGTVRSQAEAIEQYPFPERFRVEAMRSRAGHSNVAVLSKLAVALSARGGLATRALVNGVYQLNLARGTTIAWLGASPRLGRFYLRLGFLREGELAQVPGYGSIQPMRLDLLDLDHLQATGSPFAPICAAFLAGNRHTA